jgi:hypothetical protein
VARSSPDDVESCGPPGLADRTARAEAAAEVGKWSQSTLIRTCSDAARTRKRSARRGKLLPAGTGAEPASQSPRRGVSSPSNGGLRGNVKKKRTKAVLGEVSSKRMRVGAARLSCPSDRRHCACDCVPGDVREVSSSRQVQNTGEVARSK